MNTPTRLIIGVFLVLSFSILRGSNGIGPAGTVSVRADNAWAFLECLIIGHPAGRGTTTILASADRYSSWEDKHLRMLQDVGLRFCREYPDDPRCWTWLTSPPLMWRQARYVAFDASDKPVPGSFDAGAADRWRTEFARLRKACLESVNATVQQRAEVRYYELNSALLEEYNRHVEAHRAGKASDWNTEHWEMDVLQFGSEFPGITDYRAINLVSRVTRWHQRYSKDSEQLARFTAALGHSPNSAMRSMGAASESLAQIYANPLNLSGPTLDGQQIDLSNLRGRVILIHYWAAKWCGACKVDLPGIRKLAEMSKDTDLMIIGVSCDMREEDREYVKRYVAQNGMTWPNVFTGEGMSTPWAAGFGFNSIPQFLVVGRDGRLVAHLSGAGVMESIERTVNDALRAPMGN